MKIFEELGRGDCRWPVSDCGGEKGAFLFCGEAVVRKGCPYCRTHMAMAYKRSHAARRPTAAIETRGAGRRKLIELAADI